MRVLPAVLLALSLLLAGCVGDLSIGRDAPAEDATMMPSTSSSSAEGRSATAMSEESATSDPAPRAFEDRGAGGPSAYAVSPEGDAPAMRVVPGQERGGSGAASGLTAGDIDDHLNWEAFRRYVTRTVGQGSPLPSLAIEDRFTLRLVDATGAPLALERVTIRSAAGSQARSATLVSGTDGLVRVLPGLDGLGSSDRWRVEVGATTREIDEQTLGVHREATITVPTRAASPPRALDLMLVIDTTGSMSDELDYLTRELRTIVGAVEAREGVDVRVGLTVYRDEGDDYVVDGLGFTADIAQAERWISMQAAGGGGDYPEAMDRALSEALDGSWRASGAARVLLLVADAPPHAEHYGRFLAGVREARQQGVHVYPVAASGAATEAQYLMRAAAMATQGRYLFLTDDSGIGNAHDEPAVPCYVVTELDDLILRVVRAELTGERVEPAADEIVREVGSQEAGVCLDP